MRSIVLLLLCSASVFAQPFSFGIKGGVPLSDFLNAVDNGGPGTTNYTAHTQRYIVGGTAELHLPLSLSIEVDALYRRLQYNGVSMGIDTFATSRTTGNNWEFPILLKYRFHFPFVRPYLDAGAAFDTLTGLKQTITETALPNLSNTTTTSNPAELRRNTTPGFVIGGGIYIHALALHISPEIRYTRWTSPQINDQAGFLHTNQNQAEFLVGFTF